MHTENQVQDIATATAATAAQGFLNTIPAQLKEALSARFLSSLEGELQAELQALIQSRLHWSMQTLNLELAEQERLKALDAASSEPPQAESNPQQLVPASRLQTKQRNPKSKTVIELQKAPLPSPEPATTVTKETVVVPALAEENSQIELQSAARLQKSQLDLLGLSEPEPLYPRRRRSTPEASKEDILRPYNLNLEDFGARDPEAKPRRRRRRAASLA